MAGENTFTSLNGLFKVVYADKLQDLVPDFAILQKRVEFSPADKETGNYYAQPVNLSQEQGFTYAGSSGGVVPLSTPVNGQMKEAQVTGSELILRTQMSYGALARSATAGPRAFKKASAWKVEDMNNSMRKRLEIAMLYGQSGLATVASVSGNTITFTQASWAAGMWAGAEGAKIDVYQTGGTPVRIAGLTISAVDTDLRTLTTSTVPTGVVAGDVVFFAGANSGGGVYSEMAGLQTIISNTGTLFGISASSFSLWKGSTYNVGGALTFQAIQTGVSRAVNKGLMESCLAAFGPRQWGVLNNNEAALRVYDVKYNSKKNENGSESLVYHFVNGQLELVAHPMVKDGDGFIVPLDSVQRIGSTDVTFGVPGMDEQFFTLVPGSNAVELQCMCDQAIFLERPAHAIFMTGLT